MKLIIVDAHNYLHRAYHALPPLTTPEGRPIHAVYGFARMLFKLFNELKPDYCAICFDSPSPSFRKKLFPEYKATRKEIDENLITQFPLCRELVLSLGLPAFEMAGFEADDLIASLSLKGEKEGMQVVIVSTDKDLLQMVEGNIRVLNDSKGILFDSNKVLEKWGVLPTQIQDLLILMGDHSDNVPGIPGIGEKTALKLIQEYGSISQLLLNCSQLPEKIKTKINSSLEQIKKNKVLIELKKDIPFELNWKDCDTHHLDQEKLVPVLKRWGFHSLIKELVKKGFISEESSPPQILNLDCKIIQSSKELLNLIEELKNSKDFSFAWVFPDLTLSSHEAIGCALYNGKSSPYYIPMNHATMHSLQQIKEEIVLDALKSLFKEIKIRKFCYHLKQTLSFLKFRKISIEEPLFDTLIASYTLNPSEGSYRLKDLIWKYLNIDGVDLESLFEIESVKRDGINSLEIESVAKVVCSYVVHIYDLSKKLESLMCEKECEPVFQTLEMPLVEVLCDMELEGIGIDPGYLEKIGSNFSKEMRELEIKSYQLSGQEFNLNSSKQLSFILFEKLGLPPSKKKKTHYSTDESVLLSLSQSHELPNVILKYRELSKLKSTYADGLVSSIDRIGQRIHTTFNQEGTATGRLSSSNPNLQNIPIRTEYGRMIRRAFIPSPGTFFLAGDYSQIDLRVLAHLSQDEALIAAFNKGADIHRSMAAEIYSIPMDEVTPEQRNSAKAINFGIIYGQQAFGLSNALKISIPEAQAMIDNYFLKYPGVKHWIQQTLEKTKESGLVKTMMGHLRYIPEIQSKNGALRGIGERTAMNTPVQGTSAEIIKCAMIRISKLLKDEQSSPFPKLILQVHDDLLFEVSKEELKPWASRIKEEMENAVKLSVPLLAEMKYGENWADMKPILNL